MTADSRLNHMRSTLDAALEVVEDIFEGNLGVHDAISLGRAECFILAAKQAVASMSIYSPVVGVEPADCDTYSSLGSRCVEPHGHTGTHRASHGFQWTDESDRESAIAISLSMKGRTE